MIVGYARISTDKQDIRGQVSRLEKHGCNEIYQEIQSGKNLERPKFNECLNYLRHRDTLVVCRLDRLGRTTKQLFQLLNVFKEKDIKFISLDENIDITTPMGVMLFNMCSMLAEMEANSIAERTKSGLAAARARGRFGGRPEKLSKLDRPIFMSMVADLTIPVTQILKRFDLTSVTYYKYVDKLGLKDKSQKERAAMAEKATLDNIAEFKEAMENTNFDD